MHLDWGLCTEKFLAALVVMAVLFPIYLPGVSLKQLKIFTKAQWSKIKNPIRKFKIWWHQNYATGVWSWITLGWLHGFSGRSGFISTDLFYKNVKVSEHLLFLSNLIKTCWNLFTFYFRKTNNFNAEFQTLMS